jgi:hypothetical protein
VLEFENNFFKISIWRLCGKQQTNEIHIIDGQIGKIFKTCAFEKKIKKNNNNKIFKINLIQIV